MAKSVKYKITNLAYGKKTHKTKEAAIEYLEKNNLVPSDLGDEFIIEEITTKKIKHKVEIQELTIEDKRKLLQAFKDKMHDAISLGHGVGQIEYHGSLPRSSTSLSADSVVSISS